jgi:hypothetical protein
MVVRNNIEMRHHADLKFFITVSYMLSGKWYEIG